VLAVLLRGSPLCPRLCRALPCRAFYPVRHSGGFLWRAARHGATWATALCARAWGRAAAPALCVFYATLPRRCWLACSGTAGQGPRLRHEHEEIQTCGTWFDVLLTARGGIGLRSRARGRTAATA
ncbi:MAG: hypothetical protein J3K34DRAFT_448919, partial [Monoraphidium minutum]